MRCRIGHWKTGLAVQVDEEAFEWVRLTGRSVHAELLSNRRVMLRGGRGGGVLCRLSPACITRRPSGIYGEQAGVPLDRSIVPGELPLFEIHELTVDYDFAHDALVTEPLAQDHELPWPCDKNRQERLSYDELLHQCYLRIRSHMLLGGHGYFDEVGVPCEVVRSMAGGYARMLDKARAEIQIANERMAA